MNKKGFVNEAELGLVFFHGVGRMSFSMFGLAQKKHSTSRTIVFFIILFGAPFWGQRGPYFDSYID